MRSEGLESFESCIESFASVGGDDFVYSKGLGIALLYHNETEEDCDIAWSRFE